MLLIILLYQKRKIGKELINAKKTKEINRFEGSIKWNEISDEITADTKVLFKMHEDYNNKKNILENKIRKTLREKYNEYIYDVSLNNWIPDGSKVNFTCNLKVKLFSEYTEE